MNQETFRSDFKHIVWLKGQLTERNEYIRMLSRFDRTDSHQKAILKAIERRDVTNRQFIEALQGQTYEEWKQASKRLSYLTSKLIKSIERKDVLQSEICKLFNKPAK